MATKSASVPKTHADFLENGDVLFEITEVIGEVTYDRTSKTTPYEGAFLVIAQANRPGKFTFPSEQGGTISLTVDWDNPPPHTIHAGSAD